MAKYEGISDHSELALTALHRKDATCKTNYHRKSLTFVTPVAQTTAKVPVLGEGSLRTNVLYTAKT